MARITVEDCVDNINNIFEMVLVAAKRARRSAGATSLLSGRQIPLSLVKGRGKAGMSLADFCSVLFRCAERASEATRALCTASR